MIDEAISRAAGTEAHTEGQIGIRLLPSPSVRVDRLRLGREAAGSPSLNAEGVRAEIALMPLLQGGVRFTDAKVGRADIRIPVSPDGRWRLPPDITSGWTGANWAIENLVVDQLLVTTEVTSTGRTDQFFAENVGIEGQKLTGPWRLEGTTVGVPFRLVTGELGEDRIVQLKLSGGGDIYPRFDIDAKLALERRFGLRNAEPVRQGQGAVRAAGAGGGRRHPDPDDGRCRVQDPWRPRSTSTTSPWRPGRAARVFA